MTSRKSLAESQLQLRETDRTNLEALMQQVATAPEITSVSDMSEFLGDTNAYTILQNTILHHPTKRCSSMGTIVSNQVELAGFEAHVSPHTGINVMRPKQADRTGYVLSVDQQHNVNYLPLATILEATQPKAFGWSDEQSSVLANGLILPKAIGFAASDLLVHLDLLNQAEATAHPQ